MVHTEVVFVGLSENTPENSSRIDLSLACSSGDNGGSALKTVESGLGFIWHSLMSQILSFSYLQAVTINTVRVLPCSL